MVEIKNKPQILLPPNGNCVGNAYRIVVVTIALPPLLGSIIAATAGVLFEKLILVQAEAVVVCDGGTFSGEELDPVNNTFHNLISMVPDRLLMQLPVQ